MLENIQLRKYLKIIWFVIVIATYIIISIYFINNSNYKGILAPLWGISSIGTLMIFVAINSVLGIILWFITMIILVLSLSM